MKRQSSKGGPHNTLVEHLIQYRISLWPKTSGKHGFCTGVLDGPTDGWTDGRMDRRMAKQPDGPSYRDAFLTDASKNEKKRFFLVGVSRHYW